MDFLKGIKTYIVALGMVVTAVGMWLSTVDPTIGSLFAGDHFQLILEGLGFAAVRAGIAKV